MEHYQKYYKVKKIYSSWTKKESRREFSLPVGKITTCSERNSKFVKINTT